MLAHAMPMKHGARVPLSPWEPTLGVLEQPKIGHHNRGQTRSACQATASDRPFRYTKAWPMQCQWHTERICHCHQGIQLQESRYTKKRCITTEARHGARVRLPLQIYLCQPMQCHWNKERLSHCHQGSQQFTHKRATQKRHM